MSEVQTSQETQVQEVQESAQNFDLTVQDLAGLRSIIDVASTRGAFKANELEAVGRLYNKLSGFLEQVTKQNTAAQGQDQNG